MKALLYSLLLIVSLLVSGCAVSNAGKDQTAISGETVVLDGSSSYSTTNKELTYTWRQLSGPTVELEDVHSVKTTFTAPDVIEVTDVKFALLVREMRTRHLSIDYTTVHVEPKDVVSGITVSGYVKDVNGTPISGANVTIGDVTVSTDENGSYTVANVAESERVKINVTHPDYLKNSRIVMVDIEDVSQDVVLDAPSAILTFLADEGGTVADDNGAKVELPAGGYVDAAGNAYNGTIIVKMSYHPITTLSGRATFPGTFEGIDGNTTFPIQSYGFMNVELSDPSGNKLNLDGSTEATLTFPVDWSLASPATTPLWYYDEELGYWVEDGEATMQNYTTYTGTVTHFTSWNLDAKGPRARYTGCVVDENGTSVANATVRFRALNWDSYRVHTDTNGSVSVYNILANTNLVFSVVKGVGSTLYTGSKTIYLNEGDDITDDECVVVHSVVNDGNYTVTGTVYKWDYYANSDAPVANIQVLLYDGQNNIVGAAESDSQGVYRLNFTPTDDIKYRVEAKMDNMSSAGDIILQENTTIYQVNLWLHYTEMQ